MKAGARSTGRSRAWRYAPLVIAVFYAVLAVTLAEAPLVPDALAEKCALAAIVLLPIGIMIAPGERRRSRRKFPRWHR